MSRTIIRLRTGIFAACYLLFAICPLFAEQNFSFKAAPQVTVPVGVSQLSPGFGANISIDWTFLTFAKDFDFGITAGGNFSSLSVQTGDSLSLLEGMGGLMLRYNPFDRWAFRVSANYGIYQYVWKEAIENLQLVSFTLGTEFLITPYFSLFADGAYTYRAFSGSTPLSTIGANLGVKLNLSQIMRRDTRVHIEKTGQHNIFPVSWAWYENNPVAVVTVTNNERNTITNVNLNFFIESYMAEPWTFAVIPRITPGETIEVPVTALFNESLISLSQNVSANGILHVQYRSLNASKETSTPVQMPIFQRNTMSWDDDRRAAAFVSARDFSAMLMARNAAAAVEAMINEQLAMNNARSIPKNVIYAIAVFESLRLYRINYIIDPSTPYTELSQSETALDILKYPYETLYYRGGDCDDLSILYCSMLEALGVETAFITVPGHIYTAFAVGNDTWQANNRDIITIDGKRWIPIEATVTSRGFTQGWQYGIRQWRAAGDKAELFPIRECWEIYPSVTVPASADFLPDLPEQTAIREAVTRESASFR